MTIEANYSSYPIMISIHLPHTWHDNRACGAKTHHNRFQSTCHIRGMTTKKVKKFTVGNISIHMPHTWHDTILKSSWPSLCYFNPHATYVA